MWCLFSASSLPLPLSLPLSSIGHGQSLSVENKSHPRKSNGGKWKKPPPNSAYQIRLLETDSKNAKQLPTHSCANLGMDWKDWNRSMAIYIHPGWYERPCLVGYWMDVQTVAVLCGGAICATTLCWSISTMTLKYFSIQGIDTDFTQVHSMFVHLSHVHCLCFDSLVSIMYVSLLRSGPFNMQLLTPAVWLIIIFN